MASRNKKKNKSLAGRHLFIACVLVAWMGLLIWRLAYVQIARHEVLAQKARLQQSNAETMPAFRGEIVDRNGAVLVRTVDTDTVKLDIVQLEEKAKAQIAKERGTVKLDATQSKEIEKLAETLKTQFVKTLAPLLRVTENDLWRPIKSGNKFPLLAKKVDTETSNNIRLLAEKKDFSSIKVVRETQRQYPNGTVAAHLLGFVDAAEKGVSGLEKKFNEYLGGQDGAILWEKDALGQPFSRIEKEALAGGRVITTLDLALQHKVEAELAKALAETKATSASAIIMDPSTGEILALANAPTFDPATRWKDDETAVRRNRAITDIYEPGSVFKIVTYSAAIEENLVKPSDKIHCGNGQIALGSRIIHDAHPYGELTIADALAKSSNVAAIKVAQKVGKEKFADYTARFGFGKKTGIDLPAEAVGLAATPTKDGSLASMAMGHEIGVTAIQAVAAMATIANNGTWVKPHIAKKVVTGDAGQRTLWEAQPETRRVISEQTAHTIKDMLKDVVEIGTARHTVQLAGYTAAGKTGTAQKVIDGKYYSDTDYIASFAGFVPATNPRFAIIVVLDSPKGAHQGGMVAAPIFSKIAQAALSDYGVLPDTETHQQQIAELQEKFRATPQGWNVPEATPTPVKILATPTPAVKPSVKPSVKPTPALTPKPQIIKASPTPKPTPKPTPVLQLPKTKETVKTVVAAKKVPEVAKPKPPTPTGGGPNVIGRGLREVASLCSQAGLKLKAIGNGIARSQRRDGNTLIVEFR